MLKTGKIRRESSVHYKDQLHMFAWSPTASSPINYGTASSTDFGFIIENSEAEIEQGKTPSIGAFTVQPFHHICLLLINLICI